MAKRGTYWTHDSSLMVGVEPTERRKNGDWQCDWQGHACLLRVLKRLGFTIGNDPTVRHRSLQQYHRLAQRGDLFCAIEIYATGSKFEFFQEIVKENPHGGRYDFDRVTKMPYMVRKSFERAVIALKADLAGRGFVAREKVRSPVPDPLAFFNDKWDGEYEKRRGVHRFRRGEDGWPSDQEISCWDRKDADGVELTNGAVRYLRDRKGYLIRGRVYGGINGMWMVIYGPGLKDHTHAHCKELFTCTPASVPRKVPPPGKRRRAAQKMRDRMAKAVAADDFEAAASLRDKARLIEAGARAA